MDRRNLPAPIIFYIVVMMFAGLAFIAEGAFLKHLSMSRILVVGLGIGMVIDSAIISYIVYRVSRPHGPDQTPDSKN